MCLKRMIFLMLAALVGGTALAHPVSYQGALGIMAYHQPDMLDWQVTYSATSRFALGIDYLRDTMDGPERHYLIPRLNFLAARWNGKDSQANIYLSLGGGAAKQEEKTRAAAFGSIEADYETREIYFAGKASTLLARDFADATSYQLRAGVAPYVGGYDDLHTWFILQGQYFPNANEETFRVGPVLRFFKKNVLWEVGVTSKSTWSFNFMIHF